MRPRYSPARLSTDRSPLTGEEQQMLRLFAASHTQVQVGEQLGLCQRMVRYKLHRVYNYTGASNATGAVAEAIRRGWIE